MQIKLKQEKFKWNFKYQAIIKNYGTVLVEANRTLLPTPRKVKIYGLDDEVLLELKERRIFRKALDKIPLVNGIVSLFHHHNENMVFINMGI